VAGLSNSELEAPFDAEPIAPAYVQPGPSAAGGDLDEAAEELVGRCLAAAHRLDVREMELELDRASVVFSRTHLIERILVPLLRRIGDLWHQGTLRPIHEHMASSVVRSFIGGMHGAYHPEVSAPHVVVTTPARQRHELGALLAAATAAGEGWRVTYLGPDLPPEEIAAAALQKGARAVALSITYPPDDPMLVDDLRRLRRLLGSRTALVVGGRACPAYDEVLQEIGCLRVEDLAGLRDALQDLRAVTPGI
jgi:methanogenic corrinoid protein MtbC1